MIILLSYIIIVNIASFNLFRIDKRCAEQGKYRISEAVLLGISFLGGAWGAFCAMHEFHHKTLHAAFTTGVPLALLIQIVLIVWAIIHFIFAS